MNNITKTFRNNLRLMRVFGLYPPDKYQMVYTFLASVMYSIFAIMFFILGCTFLVVQVNFDLVLIADNAFILAAVFCYIFKLFPFIKNSTEIKACILYFDEPIFETLSAEEMKITKDCNDLCRKMSFIYLSCVFGSVTSWSTKPLFFNGYKLPIDIWLPFDATADVRIYSFIYLFLVIACTYNAFSSAAIDPLIAGLAYQATGQIRVLKYKLQYLNISLKEELLNEFKEQEIIINKIKKCINYHNVILNFIEQYENCFSFAIFGQFIGSIFIICITCLQLTLVDPLSFNFVFMIVYFSTMLAEIFIYCYFGAVLADESNSLVEAIYMGEWYDYGLEAKKLLITIMERSKRPTVITAGKVLDLSLNTFTTVIRRSYSLLALVKNYRN